ncbi:MAG: hypothetical protein ABR567_06405 [Myxococcales bacterium]|nr:hypothetical protein [Myxococcales bacterium]
MRRLLALLVLIGAPALAREVRGRISHTEEGSEEARKLAGGASVMRMNVVTESGAVVTLTAQEGITQVFERSQPTALAEVRTEARIKVTVDDDCKLESELCVAARIEIDRPSGLTRIDAVKEHAVVAEDPGMKAMGSSRGDARDAADDLGEPVKRRFIKGELTNLGSDKLVLADSRFGLRSGVARLDNSIYLAVAPEIDLHFGDWLALGLGLPLNVRAYADGFYDTHKLKFREGDYSRASDYARILRFLTLGRKEDQFFVNVSPLFAASIGHGAIVRRYNANIESPQEAFGYDKKVGAEIDAYGRYGGFEAFTGDLMHPNHFLAGLAFVKPLGWLTGSARETWGWTSLGVSTAMDLAAPYTLDRGPNGYPQVGDTDICPQPGVDYCEPDDPIVTQTRRAQVVGVDLETKVVKSENADVKPYLDYSRLLDISNPSGPGARANGGGGWTAGVLGRFNAGDVKVHAFRLVGELRYFDGNYLPGYFDTFYEVQKYQFVTGKADTGYEPKLRTILDRDPAHKRAGYYLEAAYQYNGGLALMAAYEDSFHVSGPDSICFGCTDLQKYVGSRNLTLHIEYPAYSWLQFFASFYRRSFDGPVDASHPLGDNTLIYGAARVHVLWIFFLNARVFRSWRPDPVLGEMKNLWGGDFDLEIGYEFDRSTRNKR